MKTSKKLQDQKYFSAWASFVDRPKPDYYKLIKPSEFQLDWMQCRLCVDSEGKLHTKEGKYLKTYLHPDRGYLMTFLFNRTYQVHRVVLFLATGEWPKNLTDHINGVKTDNRPENLRHSTHAENMRNRRTPKGASGYRGIRFVKGKWQATVRHDNKSHSVGRFAELEDAVKARRDKAMELHGEFYREED